MPHTCPHTTVEQGERREEGVGDEESRRKGAKCPSNLTVRSAHSLSSKYSDRRWQVYKVYYPHKSSSLDLVYRHLPIPLRLDAARRLRKNASLCVRGEGHPRGEGYGEVHHTCGEPPSPPRHLPDGSRISKTYLIRTKTLFLSSR